VEIFNQTYTLRARICFTFNSEEDRRLNPRHWIVPVEKHWLIDAIDIICEELCSAGWLPYLKKTKNKKYLFIFADHDVQNKFFFSEAMKQQNRRNVSKRHSKNEADEGETHQEEEGSSIKEIKPQRNIRRFPITFRKDSKMYSYQQQRKADMYADYDSDEDTEPEEEEEELEY
jgi:hypothetical protein